jgi:hypothetical protein
VTAGVGALVGAGVDGTAGVSELWLEALLGATETTTLSEAIPELELTGTPEEADNGASDVGMATELLETGVGVTADDSPVPAVPEGTMPELVNEGVIVSLPDADGVAMDAVGVIPGGVMLPEPLTAGGVLLALADDDGVSLGMGIDRLPDWEGVGTAPEGEMIPDGRMPEGIPLARLDARLLTGGVGRSETTDDSKLEMSEASEETIGGRTPDGVGTGEGVVEAVGPLVPEGSIPLISDTSEETREASGGSIPEGVAEAVGPPVPDGRIAVSSEASEETRDATGGRMPEGVGTMEGVAGAVGPSLPEGRTPEGVGAADGVTGAVGPREPGGRIPVTSETSDDTSDARGGRIPDGVGAGDSVTGAVGPAEPDGRMPVTSETREDKTDGRLSKPEPEAAPDGSIPELKIGTTGVGVADTTGPVPSAVVMPTMMPVEEGRTPEGTLFDAEAAPLVGKTTLLGAAPVEPTCGLGVA